MSDGVKPKHTFDQWCQLRYMEQYPQTLDDELPDKVDDWLADLDAEELYELTEIWRKDN